MNSAFLLFPNQLFRVLPKELLQSKVFLIENELFFSQYNFHAQKLVFHRAGMRYYYQFLLDKALDARYLEENKHKGLESVFALLQSEKITSLLCYEPHDYLLKRRLMRCSSAFQITIHFLENPSFINSIPKDLEALGSRKRYLMGRFYTQQRKKLNVLLDNKQAPVGGKWSFDEANRKKLPRTATPPPLFDFNKNPFVSEALLYVSKHFPNALGDANSFRYGISHQDANEALNDFLENRFSHYGTYQDAISQKSDFVFHSVISPYLNAGLLLPDEVLHAALSFAESHAIPLNSIEGFVRQLIGWREYVMLLYEKEGNFMRGHNFFGFDRKIPKAFYRAQSDMLPFDHSVKKALRLAYTHHIERLMIQGNFMLLCEIHPDEVYRWFMELYIDAYDWVMVPNVYGMSQFADGGLICTKPYISGSNYLLKMSDYQKGPWSERWNALYWRFLYRHKDKFENNVRMQMMLRLLEKMPKATLEKHLKLANSYLDALR